MRIEIVTDLVCPWCWLGKRRLELALEQRPDLEVELAWLPHELNPGMPEGGVPRAAFLAGRFPDEAQRSLRQRELTRLGAEIDVEFCFDRIERMPNTRAAHALVFYARQAGCTEAVIEALFRSYFTLGRDIGDPDVLTALAADCGMEATVVGARLRDRADFDSIVAMERMIENAGIEAVPHYVFNGRYACTGARDVAAFCRALDKAAV